ncbi:MAG: epoxyqueuosine reductase [Dehalococcoidales bacterium]|nr:MAG: epoxyqueuosine reductase [Dehalococcoidales bacterium]
MENNSELKIVIDDINVDKVGIVNLYNHKNTSVHKTAVELLPEAKSVIVLANELFPEVVQYLTSGRKMGELVMRDLFARNSDIVNGHLDWESYKLVKELHKLGYKGIPLTAGDAPFDARYLEGMLSYKESALIAGMGVIGWNTMLLTSEYGARVRLSCVVTDASLENTTSSDDYLPCTDCKGACVKVCPVQALKQPGEGEVCSIDKYLCNTYLVSSGGCSECLRVCPADKLYYSKLS